MEEEDRWGEAELQATRASRSPTNKRGTEVEYHERTLSSNAVES